jgi:hypothetical protein
MRIRQQYVHASRFQRRRRAVTIRVRPSRILSPCAVFAYLLFCKRFYTSHITRARTL